MEDPWRPPVERLISSFAGLADDSTAAELVNASRGRNRSLATLLSCWAREGRPLPDCLTQELDHHRERLIAYREVLAEVKAIAPDVVPAKGPSIARLYPAGVLREMADLDLVFQSPIGLWAAARHLVASGWSPQVLWAWSLTGAPSFHVELTRPSGQPLLLLPQRVELTTIAYQGDHVWRPPRLRRWSPDGQVTAADCLLWLLDELGERALRLRDLIDLAVLAKTAERSGHGAFVSEAAELVARFHVRSQLRQLVRQAARHYPEAVALLRQVAAATPPRRSLPCPWPLRRPPRAASVSLGLALARSARPRLRALADNALLAVQQRGDLRRLFELGAPLYGLPGHRSAAAVDDPDDAVVVCLDADGAAWLKTPLGRFVLSLGPALRQEWVDRAAEGRAAPVEVRLA